MKTLFEQAASRITSFLKRISRPVLPVVCVAGLFCFGSIPQAAAVCVTDGSTVTCTGNESSGIASGTDFSSPPATTLIVNTDPITSGGVYFNNSTASSVNIISGTEGAPVLITTQTNDTPGITASSQGSPSGYQWNLAVGIYVPNGPAGGGGPVTVDSHSTISTSGDHAHGIVAQNRVGTYDPASTFSLQTFMPSAVTTSLVSVAGSNANIGTAVTGNNGGAFTLNGDGLVSFSRGTLGDALQTGESLVTSLPYTVRITHNFLYYPFTNASQTSNGSVAVKIENVDGVITVQPLEISFAEFGVSSDPAGAAPLWPNLQGYVDRLLAEQGYGGNGQSIVVTNEGSITTRGNNAHGVFAETTGGNGGTGSTGGAFDGPAGVGGTGSNGGGITVTANGTITTFGNESAGVAAVSRGGNGGTGGDGGWGGWRWGGQGGNGGNGGAVTVNGSGRIETGALQDGQETTAAGNYSSGILALSEGGNGGNGGEGHHAMPGGNGGWGGSGGTVVVDGGWDITTRGIWAHGIWAKSVGGNAGSGGSAGWMGIGGGGTGGQAADGGSVTVVSRGTISTSGNDSYGIFAQSVGGFGGSGGSGGYIFYANGGNGYSAGSGGIVSVTNDGSITTQGDRGHGIYAQSVGGGGGTGIGGGAAVSIGGTGGAGGNGSTVTVTNNGSIRTYGSNARGIFAESIGGSGGSGGGSGGIVSIGGDGAIAGNGGGITVINTGTIETGMLEPGLIDPGPMELDEIIKGVSSAIHAQSIGGGGGNGAGSGALAMSLGGEGLAAGNGGAVSVTNTGMLITWADFSRGILAQSIGGGGGDGAGSGGGVASLGGNATGADTNGDGYLEFGGGSGGTVTVASSNTITTHGDYSDGIYAQSIGGGGGSGAGSGGLAYSLGGSGSGGGSGSTVTVSNTGTIRTEGYRSRGIFAQSVGGGGGDGAGSGGIASFGGSGSANGNGGAISVTNTGTIETGTFGHGRSEPRSIGTSTVIVIEGISSAIHAQSVGGGGGSGAASGGFYSMGGSGGSGGDGGAISVANSGMLITWADFSRGILAQSIGGGGGDGATSGGFISLGGKAGLDTDHDGVLEGGGNGGTVSVFSEGSITTHGDYSDGIYAQSVGGGGGIGAGTGGFIAIGGSGSRGGLSSSVTVTNSGSIVTEGYLSRGIFAQSIGGGGGDGGGAGGIVGIVTKGGSGSSTDNGGNVLITNTGAIETFGGGAVAIQAQSIGGGGGSGGSARIYSITPEIAMGAGIGGSGGTGGNGGDVMVNNLNGIITHKENSHGILSQSIGGGGGSGADSVIVSIVAGGVIPEGPPVAFNSTINIGGSGSGGGNGGSVIVNNSGGIATEDFRSHGIFAQSVGGGGGEGGSSTTITLSINVNVESSLALGGTGGAGGRGGPESGTAVQVANSGVITTRGDHSIGILAQSIGGGGGDGGDVTKVDLDFGVPTGLESLVPGFNYSINSMLGGSGGAAGVGGDVSVSSYNTISTLGSFAHGILAQSVGGGGGHGGDARTYNFTFTVNPTDFIVNNLNEMINLTNYSSTEILGGSGGGGGNGGNVTVANSGGIITQGASAYGILAQSVGGGGGAGGTALTFDFSTTDAVTNPDILNWHIDPTNPENMETIMRAGEGAAGNGGSVTVTNQGTIITQGEQAHGILAQSIGGGGGTIGAVNQYGVINTNFGGSTRGILDHTGTAATFLGSLGGDGSGGAVTVTHSGTILTTGRASHGILAQSAGGISAGAVSVTTSSNIYALGEDSSGILAQSAGGGWWNNNTILITIESGTVYGGTGSGAGVSFLDGAANTLVNRGEITTMNSITGMAVRGTGGSETISNYGTITGSVDLGTGSNAFNNNAGGVLHSGGVLNLGTGNMFTNAGTLSPGGQVSFMTTSLTGNFMQTSTGGMNMKIDRFGNHDKLEVSGAASLNGSLAVIKQPGPYLTSMTFDLLETRNDVITGTFSNVLLPEDRPLVKYELNQTANLVELRVDVQKYTTVAADPTQRAVADYLDRILADATGDLAGVLDMIQTLPLSQLNTAYASLGPATYDGLTKMGLSGMGRSLDSLRQRMNKVRAYSIASGYGNEPKPILLAYHGPDANLGRILSSQISSKPQMRNELWMDGYSQGGDQGGTRGVPGYDYAIDGSTIGYEYAFRNQMILGLSFGQSDARINFEGGTQHGSVKDNTGTLYGSSFTEKTYVESAISYGRESFRNQRYLTIGPILGQASSSHDGDAYSLYLGAGYNFEARKHPIAPFGSLRYTHLKENGFTESGAGVLDLIVDGRETESLVSELGVRTGYAFKFSNGSLIPEMSASFLYDFAIDDNVVTSSFVGSPGATFSIHGQEPAKYGAALGVGLTFLHTNGFSASAKYSGEFRERHTAHGVIGSIAYAF